jgi:hypothetical protein
MLSVFPLKLRNVGWNVDMHPVVENSRSSLYYRPSLARNRFVTRFLITMAAAGKRANMSAPTIRALATPGRSESNCPITDNSAQKIPGTARLSQPTVQPPPMR